MGADGSVGPLPTVDRPAHLPWRGILLEGVRTIFFPFLGIFVVSGPVWWATLLLFAGLLALRVFSLRFFRWWVTPDSLMIRKGVFFRSQRVLPRARIQAVDLEQGPLKRLLGLTEVRVEALGGTETEGRLPGIAPEQGARLRRVLLHGGDIEAPPEPRDGASASTPPRVAMTENEIVMAGMTENRLGVGLGVIALISEGLRQLLMNGQFAVLERMVGFLLLLPWLPLLVSLAMIALVFSVAASFIFSLQAFWDFTLRWEGDQLEVERGLFFRHRDTVPLQRIQAVQVIENPLRRLLGLASVRVLVGGRVAGGDEATANVLLPAGRRDEAFRLAQEAVGLGPPLNGTPTALGPMPPAARQRRWFRGILVSVAIGIAAALFARWSGSAGLDLLWSGAVAAGVALPVGLVLGEAAWRGLGWGRLGGEHLGFREGVLTRKTTLVPLVRVQSVEVTSNPLQRRRGLATLIVPVARPPLGFDPRGLDLEADEAEALRQRLLV